MRKVLFLAVALSAAAMTGVLSVGTEAGSDSRPTRYVVLYEANASPAAVKAAVKQAKGRILKANNKIGVATVVSANARFRSDAARFAVIKGVARNTAIGRTNPDLRLKRTTEFSRQGLKAVKGKPAGTYHHSSRAEPLADLQWDMQMIHATADGSYRRERGSKKVLVGVIDTGIDGSHPDIAPNFNRRLSRNFTRDIPLVDGPCEEEPDQSCNDPADVDENLHGTHVASNIGSPINNLGIAGVAPEVSLVNLRAGQDSGYFFVQASVDALTYAGDNGVDVVNMSYFIDPWLFNCRANAADSSEQQLEQRTIIEATQRALDYAHLRGVTLIAAAGNEHTNLTQVTSDDISPDFPPDSEYHRDVDNNCLVLPEQGNNVMGVSSLGPSKNKAYYSNYGYEKITVSAPGGARIDAPEPRGRVLGAFPESVGREIGLIDDQGNPTSPLVVKDCRGNTCGYYIYLQGTSMASPHAVGVAALIISKYGERHHGEFGLHPFLTQAYLQATATDTACPTPNPITYPGFPAEFNAFCEGTPVYNGFYGHGIVDALTAVTAGNDLSLGGDDDD